MCKEELEKFKMESAILIKLPIPLQYIKYKK